MPDQDPYSSLLAALDNPDQLRAMAMRSGPPQMPGVASLQPPQPPMQQQMPMPATPGQTMPAGAQQPTTAPGTKPQTNPFQDPRFLLLMAQMGMHPQQGAPPPHPGSAPIAGGHGQIPMPAMPLGAQQQRIPDLAAILAGRV